MSIPLSSTTTSPAWTQLTALKKEWEDNASTLCGLFAQDPSRFQHFHATAHSQGGDLLFDYSKQKLTPDILSALTALAQETGVENRRDAMLQGETLNTTENRAALHMALRGSLPDTPNTLTINGENIPNFVQALHTQIQTISQSIRDNTAITDVIHIGVGGSNLGPQLVCEALSKAHSGPTVHFINNIDGETLTRLLSRLNPENTAILIASKTFTTLETRYNANTAKDWLTKALPDSQITQRLFAMTAAPKEAQHFGIAPNHILPMRDWVGGRFSLWSSIGLPIAIALGFDTFTQLLQGARAADQHFLSAPLHTNIPVLMALISVWNRNIWDYPGQALLPYADSLSLLPTYMQQLEMESNGKACAQFKTAPILIGGPGTCAQHAFMQSIHQSAEIIPCDFLIFARNTCAPHLFQTALNANALAQSEGLMRGRRAPDKPHHHFPGNRPSSTLLLPTLNAHTLGLLLATFEHKVFTQGIIWGINSFDQWGVELGKTLAKDIISALSDNDTPDLSQHDSSTQNLISRIRKNAHPS